jgi:hypothetical protein
VGGLFEESGHGIETSDELLGALMPPLPHVTERRSGLTLPARTKQTRQLTIKAGQPRPCLLNDRPQIPGDRHNLGFRYLQVSQNGSLAVKIVGSAPQRGMVWFGGSYLHYIIAHAQMTPLHHFGGI